MPTLLQAAPSKPGKQPTGPRQAVVARVSGVSARQKVLAEPGAIYRAAPDVEVAFTGSGGAAEISVWLARAIGPGHRWYAHPANLAATYHGIPTAPGRLTFSVADLKLKPATLAMSRTHKLAQQPDPAVPGEYIIEVAVGKALAHTTLRILPPGQSVPSSRVIPGVALGAVRDSKGNILVSNTRDWRLNRYTPEWRLEETYPRASLGQSSDPVENSDIAVDSHDNVYAVTVHSIYKFGPDGNAAPWAGDDDYLKYPYPSEVKNTLGVRLDPASPRKMYIFGPGGGGAGRKEYGPEELAKPGFWTRIYGAAVDKDGNVFVAADKGPHGKRIEVFNANGNFLRAVPLPMPEGDSLAMRFGNDGTLWVSYSYHGIYLLDPETGAVRKKTQSGGRSLNVAPDGTVYSSEGRNIWRFDAGGEPLPFGAVPFARENGRYLEMDAAGNKLPAEAGGVTSAINTVVARADGGFDVITGLGPAGRFGDNSVLRFTREGAFVPDTVSADLLSAEPANIFTGDTPATMVAMLSNLGNAEATVSLRSRLLDLDGQLLAGRDSTVVVPALQTISAPFPLDAAGLAGARHPAGSPFPGYYVIEVEARLGNQLLRSWRRYGGRVAQRGNAFPPYSAFGSVRMEEAPELIRRMGGALSRNHYPVYWDEVEPKPGEWHMYPAETLNELKPFGISQMAILGYGEPWRQGGFPACRIYKYDDFFNYVSQVVSHHRNTAGMWQFWNEPNYFWHVPGPYQYEHYAAMQAAVYSICKAYDPETPVIGDGFAGSASEMAKLAGMGAAGYADGVPIHYPGVKPVSFDNMPLSGPVESKAEMVRELGAIRDQHFPGRELLNTEEGLWGKGDRTARDGAELLPRIYISQMAAGIDRLTWFETYSATDSTYLLRDTTAPWPAYFAYANASRHLENAQFVATLSDGLAQVHAFAVAGKPVIAAWSVQGERDYSLDVRALRVQVTDWQGITTSVPATNGTIKLRLKAGVQYITGADINALAPAFQKRLAAIRSDGPLFHAVVRLQRPDQDALPEKIGLRELFHAARLAEVSLMFARAPANVGRVKADSEYWNMLQMLRRWLVPAEHGGAYLRESRTVLDIAKRTAYFADFARRNGNQAYAANLRGLVVNLARQVDRYAASEKKWYPGVMVRTELETSKLRAANPAEKPLDEQFDPQITRKPGETFELETTVYNWTDKPITGSLIPVLPDGWKAADGPRRYDVKPREHARFSTTVTVPPTAVANTYSIGASTQVMGSPQREYHSARVKVQP